MTGAALCQEIGMDVISMKSKKKFEQKLIDAAAKFDVIFEELGISGSLILVGDEDIMSKVYVSKNKQKDDHDQWGVCNAVKHTMLEMIHHLDVHLHELGAKINKSLEKSKGFH